jgi:hypothetical protein
VSVNKQMRLVGKRVQLREQCDCKQH